MHFPDFIQQFNIVKVPEIEQTIDDATGPWAEIEQDYFNRIIASFKMSQHAIGVTFDIDRRMLVPADMSRASNDFISELWVKDRQPIATTLRVRNELNYQVVLFNKYPLLPSTIETIEAIKRAGI
jgi:hypothetical protein